MNQKNLKRTCKDFKPKRLKIPEKQLEDRFLKSKDNQYNGQKHKQ